MAMAAAPKAPSRNSLQGFLSSSKRPWALAAISGVLQVLVFPSPAQYWLCWVALVPLLLALAAASQQGARRAFVVGYFSGILWYAGSCAWVVHVMNSYGDLPFAVASGILILFALYLGLY